MKKSFLRVFSMLVSLAMVFSLFSNIVFAAGEGDTVKKITIFHTNDMHGRLVSAFNSAKPPVLTQIGADYVASIKKSVPGSILIDAGDATQGLPFANLSKGADVIRLMNAAGYDGMALGNHEFDFGTNQLLANVKNANFPVVSANTIYKNKPLLSGINGNNGEDFIKTVDGVKVGFFGITTQETAYKTNPTNIQGVTFKDPIQTAKDEVAKLQKEGAQVIVGIMHIGNDSSSSPISEDIAKAVDGIDVIIDGHSHTVENSHAGKTLIAQTQCYSANVGKIEITLTDNKVTEAKESLISAANATADITPDSAVSALAKDISASQAPIFAKIVGSTKTSLWGGTVNGQSVGRLVETNLGDLVADSMVYGAKSQVKGTQYEKLPIVSLENGGGVRDTIPAGYINRGQVISVLPFGNILSLKVVTPNVIYEMLENGVSKISGVDPATGVVTGPDGRFPQISGMRFEYDPTKTASNTDPVKGPLVTGNRVAKVVLLNADGKDGKVLNRNDKITKIVLASNDFEIAGGDGYTMLGKLKNIGEGNALDVIFEEYIGKLTKSSGGSFSYPNSQGRSKAITSHVYMPYSATVTVKNGENLVANQEITYSIDKGQSVKATTDQDGKLKIENIPNGPHSLTVSYNNLSAELYVNDLLNAVNLTASLTSWDNTIAAAIINIIAALPETITLGDKASIEEALAAFDSLNENQQKLVTNINKLAKAAEKLITLLTASNNQAAAKLVMIEINGLPKMVKLADEAKVIAARKAYNALTLDQQKLVTNYNKLLIAEKQIAELKKVKSVKLNKTSAAIKKGSTLKLSATVNPTTAANKKVIWSSSNKAIATVDANGKITANKAGKAVITVKTVDGGKTATCKIRVL